MEQFDVAKPSAVSSAWPSKTARDLIRSCIASRWGLIISGTAIVVVGLALGWNWLTAVGLAPLIISVAPCLIMCALGMCMMSRGSPSSATQSSVDQEKLVEPTPTTTQSGELGT